MTESPHHLRRFFFFSIFFFGTTYRRKHEENEGERSWHHEDLIKNHRKEAQQQHSLGRDWLTDWRQQQQQQQQQQQYSEYQITSWQSVRTCSALADWLTTTTTTTTLLIFKKINHNNPIETTVQLTPRPDKHERALSDGLHWRQVGLLCFLYCLWPPH